MMIKTRKKGDDKEAQKKKEEKEAKKKKAQDKKDRVSKIEKYVQDLGSHLYKGMEDLKKRVGEVKDHVDHVGAQTTEKVIEAMSV